MQTIKKPIWELPTLPEINHAETSFYNYYIANQHDQTTRTIFGVSKNSGEKYELDTCPRCAKHNLEIARQSGICIWCNFNINPTLTEHTYNNYYNRNILSL